MWMMCVQFLVFLKAYNLMREYNKELKAKGYIVVAGKISTKFLAEKIYGMKVED